MTFADGIFYGKMWSRNKKIKERLVKEFGICYWCKIPVKIYLHEDYRGKGLNPPTDEATLDHLKSRKRGRELGEVTPKVLSCRKCNNQREYY